MSKFGMGLAIAILMALVALQVWLLAGGQGAGYELVPRCATEDSTGCIWVADKQGNKQGTSVYNP